MFLIYIRLNKLETYDCPLCNQLGENKGSFDEAGYEIDHIIEYSITHDDNDNNLQALCNNCHAVKTKEFMRNKNKYNIINPNLQEDIDLDLCSDFDIDCDYVNIDIDNINSSKNNIDTSNINIINQNIYNTNDCDIEVCNLIEYEKDTRFLKILQMIRDIVNNNDINEGNMSLIFFEMMKDNLIVTNDKGDGFLWNTFRKLWEEKNSNILMNEIRKKDNLILKSICVIEQEYIDLMKKFNNNIAKNNFISIKLGRIHNIKKIIQSLHNIKNIYDFAQIELFNEDFKKKIKNRQHNLLPILDGKIINLETCEIRDRIKDDNFSFECPVNYIPEIDWTAQDKKDLLIFIQQNFNQDQEYIKYIQINLGSYLCGEKSKNIDINLDCDKSGVNYIINVMCIILGGFFQYIEKNVIMLDPKKHRKIGEALHSSYLIAFDGKRLIVIRNLEKGDIMDLKLIKKIINVNSNEGLIVQKYYSKKTIEIFPFCKLIICCDNIPLFSDIDKKFTEDLIINSYNTDYFNQEEINDNFYNKYTKIGRNIDIFFSWLVHGCIEFYAKYNNKCDIPKPKIIQKNIEKDVVSLWIFEECETVTVEKWNQMTLKEKKYFRTARSKMYEKFSQWAQKNEVFLGYGKGIFNNTLSINFRLKKLNTCFVYERIRLKN